MPPLAARFGSGSGRTLTSLSSFNSSLDLSNCDLYFDMFLMSRTLAAVIGIFFVKRDRSRTALAERTIGGRKRDMGSKEWSYREYVNI